MNNVTAGIYIFNKKGQLLVCHPNEMDESIWSIPKGLMDRGEIPVETAMREMEEETGIHIEGLKKKLQYVGSIKYENKPKMLIAYTLKLDDNPPVEDLVCKSTFKSLYSGKRISEIDKFQWIDYDAIQNTIQPEQTKLWGEFTTK